MPRSSSLFRHLALLALAAVLLSVAAPTTSRVLSATISRAAPVLMEMCTSAGFELVDVSPFLGGDGEPAEPEAPTAAMGADCGYCVLSTPLPVVVAVLVASPPWSAGAPVVAGYARGWPVLRNLRGLGSQAPPLAF